MPSEISKLFGLTTGTKDDQEIQKMESLENEFHRQEWKRRKLEDLKEEKALSDCEEMWAWDSFVTENWDYSTETKANDY